MKNPNHLHMRIKNKIEGPSFGKNRIKNGFIGCGKRIRGVPPGNIT